MKTFADYSIDTRGASSGNVKTTCPECSPGRTNNHDPCLSVNVAEGVWKCHHCGFSGGLPKDDGEIPYAEPPQEKPKPNFTTQPVTPDALAWLQARGISEATAAEFNIKSCVYWFPQLEEKGPAVAIPFYRGGKVVNVKIRSITTKAFAQVKGGDQILFNRDQCLEQSIIAITEGELDAMAIREAGFQGGVCSCPNGAPAPGTKQLDKKLAFVDEAAGIFERADAVVLAMDNDEAGVPWAEAIADRIGLHKCRVVTWASGCKDANDVLVSHGPEVLAECLMMAKPVPVPGIVLFEQQEDSILKYFDEGGADMGYRTGWRGIDELLRLDTKTLNILTGIPMSGKSEWLDQLMLNSIKQHGWRWAVYSPENYPLENHFQKLSEKHLNKPMFPSYAQQAMTRDEVKAAIRQLSPLVINLSFGERPANITEIITRLKVCKQRWNTNACIIDPYNELDHTRKDGMSESEYISEFLATLRNFGRLYDMAIWIVAHPTKLQKNDKTGEYPVPTPYDISGSAHWRNKADVCVAIWRSMAANDGMVDVHVQKVRNKNMGRCGVAKLKWTKATGVFSDAGVPDEAVIDDWLKDR